MTDRQLKKISMNLEAFTRNFGEIRIEEDARKRGAFYVFYPEDSEIWVQYCPDISFLDGWLYGCVQGAFFNIFRRIPRRTA